jgi:hypothetical protein
MYASNMEKPLVLPVTSKNMKELTLERSPLHIAMWKILDFIQLPLNI